MEQINEELQMIAVEKVLEEMSKATQNLMKWNAYWCESYDNVVVPREYIYAFYDLNDVRECTKIYGEEINCRSLRTDEYLGLPLKRIVTNPVYTQDVCTIKWSNIQTNNSIRNIVFNNNGEISLKKYSKKNNTRKNSKSVSYDMTYNVTSNDFDINVTVCENVKDYFNRYKYDCFTFTLDGNILTKKINDIEIVEDLSNGMKVVRIVKKHSKRDRNNNASILFECVLDSCDNLEMGAVVINTHKGNGKVNGTYRFDVSREKGVRANFYSRKGVKIDLTKNSMLLESANNLLLPATNNNSELIVSDFANSTQRVVTKNLSERVISFDNTDFNMDMVKASEDKIIKIIKSIKGEIPLDGLVERIDNCISLFEKLKGKEIKVKKLRLTDSKEDIYG